MTCVIYLYFFILLNLIKQMGLGLIDYEHPA